MAPQIEPGAQQDDAEDQQDQGADESQEEGGEEFDPNDKGKPLPPELQAQYTKVMDAAYGMLYGNDTTHNGIVAKLKGEAQNLPFGIGHTAAMMLKSIQGNAEQSHVMLAPEVLLQAGVEIVSELCDIAAAAGLAKDKDPELFKQACFQAAKVFGDSLISEGRVTPGMQAGAKADMAAVRAKGGKNAKKNAKGIVNRAMQMQAAPQAQPAAQPQQAQPGQPMGGA